MCRANEQYGIPTPKALPAFSAEEAESVAKSFGRSYAIRQEVGRPLSGRFKEAGSAKG